jgi:hypothetical protein
MITMRNNRFPGEWIMKNHVLAAFLAACVCLAAFAPRALAAENQLDLGALLPKDSDVVLRVDVAALFNADLFHAIEDSIFKRIDPDSDSYKNFMLFLKRAELDPRKEKGGRVVSGHVGEVILVKRNLDDSTDDTSALVGGRVNLEYASKKLRARLGSERVRETDYQGRKIYRFADLFRKGEAVYFVQLKGAIAVTLSEKEAKEYVDREEGKLEGIGKNEGVSKKLEYLRPAASGSQAAIWGVVCFTEESRKRFAESKDPEEMMLQHLEYVTLTVDLGGGFVGGVDVRIECDCAEEAAGFMETALKVLRGKLVLAMENPEARDVLQKASITLYTNNIVVRMNPDSEACESLLESLGWMAFGPRETKETEAGETGPGGMEPGETAPGDAGESAPEGAEEPAPGSDETGEAAPGAGSPGEPVPEGSGEEPGGGE